MYDRIYAKHVGCANDKLKHFKPERLPQAPEATQHIYEL